MTRVGRAIGRGIASDEWTAALTLPIVGKFFPTGLPEESDLHDAGIPEAAFGKDILLVMASIRPIVHVFVNLASSRASGWRSSYRSCRSPPQITTVELTDLDCSTSKSFRIASGAAVAILIAFCDLWLAAQAERAPPRVPFRGISGQVRQIGRARKGCVFPRGNAGESVRLATVY
jgi:hypothetical protein